LPKEPLGLLPEVASRQGLWDLIAVWNCIHCAGPLIRTLLQTDREIEEWQLNHLFNSDQLQVHEDVLAAGAEDLRRIVTDQALGSEVVAACLQ